MQLTAPSPLLLNKGQPSSPCYCHIAGNLQGSQIGTSPCSSSGAASRSTHPRHGWWKAAGMPRQAGSCVEAPTHTAAGGVVSLTRTLGTPSCKAGTAGRGKDCSAPRERLQQLQSRYQLWTPWVMLENSLQLLSVSSRSSRDSETPSSLFHTLRPQLFRKSNVLHSIMSQFYL